MNATGWADNQPNGASFKIVTDLADWNATLMINVPGQSADPANPHYSNIFLPILAGRKFSKTAKNIFSYCLGCDLDFSPVWSSLSSKYSKLVF